MYLFVLHNKKGANMPQGIATCFLQNGEKMIHNLLACQNHSGITRHVNPFFSELLYSDLFGLEKLEEIHFDIILLNILRIGAFFKNLRGIL